MNKPLAISSRQLASKDVRNFLRLLMVATSDGCISNEDIASIASWLLRNKDISIPAVAYIRNIINETVNACPILDEDRRLVFHAILRVLPPEERSIAKARFVSHERNDENNKADDEEQDNNDFGKATEKQINFMSENRIRFSKNCTKTQASDKISDFLNSRRSVTDRQLMVLRFWKRTYMSRLGKQGVSEWLNGWYSDDPMRLKAWELWKKDNKSSNASNDPQLVPLGMGYVYLQKIQQVRAMLKRWFFMFVILPFVVIIIMIISL